VISCIKIQLNTSNSNWYWCACRDSRSPE